MVNTRNKKVKKLLEFEKRRQSGDERHKTDEEYRLVDQERIIQLLDTNDEKAEKKPMKNAVHNCWF